MTPAFKCRKSGGIVSNGTDGATGQTNFSADMGDLEQGFFKAVNNNVWRGWQRNDGT